MQLAAKSYDNVLFAFYILNVDSLCSAAAVGTVISSKRKFLLRDLTVSTATTQYYRKFKLLYYYFIYNALFVLFTMH